MVIENAAAFSSSAYLRKRKQAGREVVDGTEDANHLRRKQLKPLSLQEHNPTSHTDSGIKKLNGASQLRKTNPIVKDERKSKQPSDDKVEWLEKIRMMLESHKALTGNNGHNPLEASRTIRKINQIKENTATVVEVSRESFMNTSSLLDKDQVHDLESAYWNLKERYSEATYSLAEKDKSHQSELQLLLESLERDKGLLNTLTAQISEKDDVYESRIKTLRGLLNDKDVQLAKLQGELGNIKHHEGKGRKKLERELQQQIVSVREQIVNIIAEYKHSFEEMQKGFSIRIFDLKKAYQAQLQENVVYFEKRKEEARLQENSSKGYYESLLSEKNTEFNRYQQMMEAKISTKQRELDEIQVELDRTSKQLSEKKKEHLMALDEADKLNMLLKENQQMVNDKGHTSSEFEYKVYELTKSNESLSRKLFAEESLRRQLHNTIQELKGNIRVFCRIRPFLPRERKKSEEIESVFHYPDSHSLEPRELLLKGPTVESSLGHVHDKNYFFSFDRVFSPEATNESVFQEITHLVQSAIDGYNVSIFAYGQTGSGKSYTMLSNDGMVTRAVKQIFEYIELLKEKGWNYKLQGQFLEIYNEKIYDLLDKNGLMQQQKHDIHHDERERRTTVDNVRVIDFEDEDMVYKMLGKAAENRFIAATKANERSSRSHTVFTLYIDGWNESMNQVCRGTLNLVDLAGSERLSFSQAEGERLRETQAINKSLSCLGDVIHALGVAAYVSGKGKNHIPYRNSKLTYLLRYALGENAKTLMFVNVSPLKSQIMDTLNSLRFAKKVNDTRLGPMMKNRESMSFGT
ncbi:kinesin-14 family minus-end directed microtubule motor Pkl1 [Schizosaccharomyces osmophilus]|uniref:Kinesin-like protein n=1 Tax=Schizosaccharomyces osmophilus TaxID=2545709 RepID=A0AAE9WFK5_9SCHI|nr:kinesin-14 family minus-end directed microtubule motor Pkl1 [Schizosaccharomyces osmophilus]WBW74361.1 kinesin-14 family minus-end directed microtubule motor Pkl1 [Schizosaccharomyces osmophilus]